MENKTETQVKQNNKNTRTHQNINNKHTQIINTQ